MTHDERVYHHLYVESKSPLENAERIASLEELVEGLQSENAKLRSELESVGTAAYLYGRSDLKAENSKLREQIHYLMKGDLLHVLTDQEYIDQCERERLMQVSIDALDKENEKFRELCEYLWEFAKTCGADHPLLRELGVEVDG